MKHMRYVLAAALLLAGPSALPAGAADTPLDDIKEAILRLPYYGPFDAISVDYDRGTVTLSGFAYAVGLKHDAERAVKRIAGVDDVNDQIEELPLSQFDDDLRWRAFYAIYTNAFLSRYAPGGGLLWGHRDGLRWRQVPGLEPIGNYPIHIIVKGGRIQLLGVVDSEADRTAANLAARGVSGSFGVDNLITVHHSTT
jgi:hyperosmotically inducible protein